MRRPWVLVLALCLGLGVGFPPHAAGLGHPLLLTPDVCSLDTIDGTFTATRASYKAGGGCDVQVARVGIQRVSLTAVGAYDQATGRVEENIVVPPAPIDRPSHRYGKFRARMTCSGDPWLSETVTCQDIVSAYDTTLDSGRDLELTLTQYGRPYTSVYVGDRNAMIAKRKAQLDGQQRSRRLEQYASTPKGSMAPGATNTFSFPKILAPVGGQRFGDRTAIPIRLQPPHGWTVGSYMVELQREDKNGSWIAHATIPVGADEAQKAGYTGFGAGAPPAFLSVPGSWRVRAQASSPKPSGWSEWVEFTVGSNVRRRL